MLFSGSLTLFSTIPFDSSCSILLSDFCLEQPVSFIPQSSLRFKFFAFGLLLAHAFVASAGGAAVIASYFFSAETGARSPSPRIPQNWAEPEECGRRRANIEWSEPRLPNSCNSLQVSKCVTTTEARAAAGTHTGFRRDSTQNCFCYWCASVAVGVSHSLLSVLQIHAPFEGEEPCSQRRGPPTHKQGPYRSPVQALDPLWR